jgi:hypothetical protein
VWRTGGRGAADLDQSGSSASEQRLRRSESEKRADSGNFSLLAEHINRNILACFICSAKFVDPKVGLGRGGRVLNIQYLQQ